MDTAKGGRTQTPGARPSRHIFTSIIAPSQGYRRIRCWAICPVADELELEDWMVSGSIDG